MNPTSNAELADLLAKLADLLEEEGAPAARSSAWHAASSAVRSLRRSVAEVLYFGGLEAVALLPGVGPGMAVIISAMLETEAEADAPAFAYAS